ncbi:hypothetical protein AVEN_272180-1 [Araneus ventricosus]|uniref:Uncharacterized protein n=1 Tax=Araneus ventricosus TaxID=182803 RepID=A0A4Y2HVR8_ARAVE|nr:hypothetical protein AVEN_272180-1 [Araneus ventricosus]
MRADNVCSDQEQDVELPLAGKHAIEGKSNYNDTDGDLVHRDNILKESTEQLVDKCALWMFDQNTRWGATTPLTSLKDKVTCEASLSNISKTGKKNVIMSDN